MTHQPYSTYSQIGFELRKLWENQASYNTRIRSDQSPDAGPNIIFWAKQYLLGLVGEVDEVLREINWKSHRAAHPIVKSNLARELADVTKYTFSLWQLYGYTVEDMLAYASEKTEEMEQLYRQEFAQPIPFGAKVVISDVDGTIGDWRKAFTVWCAEHSTVTLQPDTYKSMAMESELQIPFQTYVDLKRDFEEQGGYQLLEPFEDSLLTLQNLAGADGCEVLIYTHRPFDRYSRLWNDTWFWLNQVGLSSYTRELHMGGEERITRAIELRAAGHPVALLEDDPAIARRALFAGITVFLRDWPYNQDVPVHPLLYRVDNFDDEQINEDLEAQRETISG